jgi:hemerythrin-like domain-containing protein
MKPDSAGAARIEPGSGLTDFGQPLEALRACHARIAAHCDLLEWLGKHLRLHECDAEAQQVASYVLRYFDSAGRHHHEDEDRDLFPHMREAARGENAERVALLVAQLTVAHREMAGAWNVLRESLELIAHGERMLLRDIDVDSFCKLHHTHIALEEANVLPLAAMILDPVRLKAIGTAMAARRGVKWP